MASHYVREGSLGTASGSSYANARSIYDIETWCTSVAPGDSLLFHPLDDFLMPGHGNSPLFRIQLAGTKTAPITLRGALPDGGFAKWHVRGERMRTWNRSHRGSMQGKGLFDIDGDYINILDLEAHHMSWVFRSVGSGTARSGWNMNRCKFEQVTRVLETKTGSDGAGLKYSTFRDIDVRGHSKSVFKIQGDSHYVWIIGLDADSQFQDGDNFAAGVQFDGDAHHGYVQRSTFRNIRDTLDDYWNGDGVSAEGSNDYIEVDGCTFLNITDGGVDTKAPHTTIKNSKFYKCKKSVRNWGPTTTIDNIRSFEPTQPGGNGEACHIWHHNNTGPVVAKNSLFVNKETTAEVLISDGEDLTTPTNGRLENWRVVQRADAPYFGTGPMPTADARTTRKVLDPVPDYGPLIVGPTPSLANNGTATTTPFTLTKPTDVASVGANDLAVNDVLLCAVLTNGTGGPTGLTGFISQGSSFVGGGSELQLFFYTKVVTGNEAASYTISHATAGRRMEAVMIPVRGVDVSNLFSAMVFSNTGGSSSSVFTTHNTPALPLTTSESLIFHFLGLRANTTAQPPASTNGSTVTEIVEYGSTGGLTIEIATETWADGLKTLAAKPRTSAVATRSTSVSVALRPLPA